MRGCNPETQVPDPPLTIRRLHLLRHAKSSWDDPTRADHARPLSTRGTKAGERMRRWLAENDVRPQVVVCSTAVRARETLDLVLPALGAPHVLIEAALYHAPAERLLDRVHTLPDDAGSAMLVGHNPGLERLAALLAAPGSLRDTVNDAFPTGALATLVATAGSWRKLEPGSMSLTGLVLPRLLR